jgi:hypothetical protein
MAAAEPIPLLAPVTKTLMPLRSSQIILGFPLHVVINPKSEPSVKPQVMY